MTESTTSRPARVLVVEDDERTRRALTRAITAEPALRLLAAVSRAAEARAWLDRARPDVLLTDLVLSEGGGIELIRACAQRYPDCGILVVTTSSDERNVLACIEAGASGYVVKGAGLDQIARAILDLRSGGSPLSPSIARMLLAKLRGRQVRAPVASGPGGAVRLTKKEAAILDLIAQGGSYSEVARVLSVSIGTVQTHIKNIYGKLSVHSRSEAVFEACRRGWLTLGAARDA